MNREAIKAPEYLKLVHQVNKEMYNVLLDLKVEVASVISRPGTVLPEERKALAGLIGRAEKAMVKFEQTKI